MFHSYTMAKLTEIQNCKGDQLINSPDYENNNSTSIAFVNVINFKSIIPLFMNLRNYKIEQFGKTYNLKISYSSVQGKPKLKEFIQQYKFSKY